MSNIILQHWTGEMNELGVLSSDNISNYAMKIDADYKLLRGDVFRPNLKRPWPPIQKLHMLSEEFDDYDMVVMLDIDMFTRKGMEENIFKDVSGVGLHDAIQKRLLNAVQRNKSKLSNPDAPWWGGAVYRLNKDLRQKLRAKINEDEINNFCGCGNYGDEGLMHRLASLAKINPKGTYFPDNKWCFCSYREGIENASLIHVRTKIKPEGPKRTKIENYRNLVKRGLIE